MLGQQALGYEFDMTFQTKCVMEEINKNVLVVGDYSSYHRDDQNNKVAIDVKVEDPHGKTIYDKRGESSGQFAFTTTEEGDYKACFTAPSYYIAQTTKIKLDWKTGVAAKDWNAIAKKENLDAMATELLRLEETVREIYFEMLSLREREHEMREVNEATNSRVAWFSVASLIICISLAAWQLWYLKNFFVRKKLL